MTKAKTPKAAAKPSRKPVGNKRVNASKPGDQPFRDDIGGTTQSGEVTGETRPQTPPTNNPTPPHGVSDPINPNAPTTVDPPSFPGV